MSAVHAMSDDASVAYSRLVACPAQGCDDGAVGGCACEVCGGSGRVEQRSYNATLRAVQVQLRDDGILGDFETARLGNRFTLRFFHEDRIPQRERRARHVAEQALLRAGYRAVNLPGFDHVLVSEATPIDETRPANDHESTLHNAEPAPELVVECESDTAFVERYEAEIDTAAE